MSAKQVAIRLKTEGKAEVVRDFADVGKASQQAYGAAEASANAAGTAADRQEQKLRKLAKAAREAASANDNQAKFNLILGVGDVGKSARESADFFEEQFRAMELVEKKTAALRAVLDPSAAAQQRLNLELAEYKALAASGAITTQELAAAQAMARKRFDETALAVDRAGRNVSAAQARFAKLNLVRQGADVFTTAAMGMNPGLIAIQQGPQILDAIAMSGMKLSPVMIGVGGAIAAAAAAMLALGLAMESQAASQKKLEVAAEGAGRAAGLTGDELMRLADQGAAAGEVSVGAARAMADEYVRTSRIGGDTLLTLIGLTKDYAKTMGIDAKAATAELAGAFANPARGADILDQKLGFLDDKTRAYIQKLVRQNDYTAAQKVLADALSRSLVNTADKTTGLGNAWDTVARKAKDAWDWMGRAALREMGMGSKLDRLRILQKQRETYSGFGWSPESAEEIQLKKEIAADKAKADAEAAKAKANTLSTHAGDITARMLPNETRRKELEGDRATLEAALKNPGALADPAATRRALEATNRELRALAAGYGAASSQASALGRAEREREKDARDATREAEDAARKAQALGELRIRNEMAVAKLRGDSTDLFERELHFRELISQFEAGGLTNAQARLEAQRQVTLEVQAEAAARKTALDAATGPGSGFVSSEDRAKEWSKLDLVLDNDAKAMDVLKKSGEGAFDRFADLIARGKMDWASWADAGKAAAQDLFGTFIKLAVLNPLKNMLFGTDEPTLSGGFLGKLLGGIGGKSAGGSSGASSAGGFFSKMFGGFDLSKLIVPFGTNIGANAQGVQNWRGGLTWVGERGKELVNLPGGSDVFDHSRSMRMARQRSEVVRAPPVQVIINTPNPQAFQSSKSQIAGQLSRLAQQAARVS